MTKDILDDNDFSENGTPNNEAKAKVYMPDKRKIRVNHKTIEEKIKEYNQDKPADLKIHVTEQEKFYENPDNTINIYIDDVSVKKQKKKGLKIRKKAKIQKHTMSEIQLFTLKG